MFLAVAAGALALIFAFVLTSRINKQDAGTERMREIAGSIAEGARAFLFAEYKILAIFAAVLFVVLC
ncbi:MAG: sodium/proton-translocating pyrophosphatase, partial [Oscillospiraceae bacterium]|nr:sodium/proton-translocating pyrophosphatase [Oscillospiraceae bacterium]